MSLIFLFLIPLISIVLIAFMKRFSWISRIQFFAMILLFMNGLALVKDILKNNSIFLFNDIFYLDALSGLMIIIITLLSVFASIYSSGYMTHEIAESPHSIKKLKSYYFLFNSFIIAMILTVTCNSLGMMWISIEFTTLISAFLVGFYNKKAPVEAAWKYIILCTVGIAFAMIGIILGYYAVTHIGAVRDKGLNWDYLVTVAHRLDPDLMKVAFIFVLIGFGTKAGLAPMHAWLPDAHSESPTPVSALLSGALVKCGLYGVMRFAILTNLSVGNDFTNKIILIFGIMSIGISVPFILIQRQIKRLFAYSTLEHMGIIVAGLGFGTKLSVFGALFHMINHALIKSVMFFASGNLSLKYKTKDMDHIRGAAYLMPISGVTLIIGGLALAGLPPFSIFVSEFYILVGGLQSNHYIITSLFILFLTVIFGGLTFHLFQITIGLPNKSEDNLNKISIGEISRSSIFALILPLLLVFLFGFWLPQPLNKLLSNAAEIYNTGYSF